MEMPSELRESERRNLFCWANARLATAVGRRARDGGEYNLHFLPISGVTETGKRSTAKAMTDLYELNGIKLFFVLWDNAQ